MSTPARRTASSLEPLDAFRDNGHIQFSTEHGASLEDGGNNDHAKNGVQNAGRFLAH